MGFNRRPIDALDLVISMSKAALPLIRNNCKPQEMYEAMLDVIAAAPGVTMQEWTPMSEPPKENGEYLCMFLFSANGDCNKYMRKILFWEDNLWLEKAGSFRSYTNRQVLCWMPLPDPPKGEKTDARHG